MSPLRLGLPFCATAFEQDKLRRNDCALNGGYSIGWSAHPQFAQRSVRHLNHFPHVAVPAEFGHQPAVRLQRARHRRRRLFGRSHPMQHRIRKHRVELRDLRQAAHICTSNRTRGTLRSACSSIPGSCRRPPLEFRRQRSSPSVARGATHVQDPFACLWRQRAQQIAPLHVELEAYL